MLSRPRPFLTLLFGLVLTSVLYFAAFPTRPSDPVTKWISPFKSQSAETCGFNVTWLADLNITYPIRYARRDILVKPVPGLQRASITKINQPLFPEAQILDLSQDKTLEIPRCNKPLELEVPAPAKDVADASHIFFGLSTTVERLDASIPQLLRWLPTTNAKLFAIVVESEQLGPAEGVAEHQDAIGADPGKKQNLESKMRGLGMDVTLIDPLELQAPFSVKYFSLVKIMYESRNEKTKWISLLDDDTFIPSMPALLLMLAKYNTEKEHYIGGLSEDWWSVTHYGLMAFGGAGVFLSITLAEALNHNYRRCLETSFANAGDIRLMECIYSVTQTKLTFEIQLHQIDVRGDQSGVYESGIIPLSLHHWKPGEFNARGYNLPKMHLVADVCGDCFLQRWQFGQNMILANGFSVAYYPKGHLKDINMEQREETWELGAHVEDSNNAGVEQSLAPIRPKLDLEQEKLQYLLIHATAADGGVRQFYLRPGMSGDIESLLELFWIGSKSSTEPP
ncbi:hypothetical protein MMC21_003464 [Puttea exsequens]|nr:hypothetical protein [Puttea exsequens]